jgi:hypothetical protein
VMATPTTDASATTTPDAASMDDSMVSDATADSTPQDVSPRRPPRRPPRTGVSLPVTTIQTRYGAPPAPGAWS